LGYPLLSAMFFPIYPALVCLLFFPSQSSGCGKKEHLLNGFPKRESLSETLFLLQSDSRCLMPAACLLQINSWLRIYG